MRKQNNSGLLYIILGILFVFGMMFSYWQGIKSQNSKWEETYQSLSEDHLKCLDDKYHISNGKLDAEWHNSICQAQFNNCFDIDGKPILCRIIVQRYDETTNQYVKD